MKFQIKYYQEKDITYRHIPLVKGDILRPCLVCTAETRWYRRGSDTFLCSEECVDCFIEPPYLSRKTPPSISDWKDILIVFHNQLSFLKECLDSLLSCTENFTLHLWDNNSDEETRQFLHHLIQQKKHQKSNWKLKLWHADKNYGFIFPNNTMFRYCASDYVILLNSDTRVYPGWDTNMLLLLQQQQDLAQVGYLGGDLDSNGRGHGGSYGEDIDYVCGWCFCVRRKLLENEYLFDSRFRFAYCEDSDLSLRLKQKGYRIFAIRTPLVYHYQNVTIKQIHDEGKIDIQESFDANHRLFYEKWKEYLQKKQT